MTARVRHEHQIKRANVNIGGVYTFDRALDRAIMNHPGLSFFTDEQIAEIRAEMIEREWFRHKLNRENRKARKQALAIKEKAA